MSSFRKKGRPLSRQEQTYADDTLLIVACEDRYAPEQCFRMLPNERMKVITLSTLDTKSNPTAIFERLYRYKDDHDLNADDQLWLALDTDHWASGNHKKALSKVLQDCKQLGVQVAMSNPCFDLWLLLHQADVDPGNPPANCNDVARRFRELTGEFSKTRLKSELYPHTSIITAVQRAKTLDVDPENWFPDNPCTRIYRIVEQAVEKDFLRLNLGS